MDSKKNSIFCRYKLQNKKHHIWSELEYAEFIRKYNVLILKKEFALNLIHKAEDYAISIDVKKINDYSLLNKFYKLCGLRYIGFECVFTDFATDWNSYIFIFKILNNTKLNYAKIKYGF